MGDRLSIASKALTAEIAPFGAELQSLRDAGGREVMHDGNPAWWHGRAPLLFPIVGRLNGDRYRLGDTEYRLEKHGFARRSMFEVIGHSDAEVTLRLTDSDATRAMYPFAFALEMRFALTGTTLAMTATVINTGTDTLPASFGYHPAFAWPLPFGGAREDHRIEFEADEPTPLRSITADGLIGKTPRATPVRGRTLAMADDLFTNDALVWDDLASGRLTYGPPGSPSLDIEFPDTRWLGIWTKPGAPYVCIEPWAGMADPEGYAGDFRDKRGIMMIPPGEQRAFRMNVTLRSEPLPTP